MFCKPLEVYRTLSCASWESQDPKEPVPIHAESFYPVLSKLQTLLKEQVGLTNGSPGETDEAAAVLGEALSPAWPADAEGAPFQFPAPFFEA